MSPIGGIGINLAIQDAVAAANILTSGDPGAVRRCKRSNGAANSTRVTAIQVLSSTSDRACWPEAWCAAAVAVR